MTILESWAASPLAAAAGWTLLHSLWEGAVIAALLGTVLLGLGSPRRRYGASCAAMAALLGSVAVTFFLVLPGAARASIAVFSSPFPASSTANGGRFMSPSNSALAAIAPWLTPFWIAGVWIFYLRQVAGWVSVSRLRRRGVCHAPEQWQQELKRWASRLRISRPVLLLESSLADAPMVLGHFRPFILVPVGLLAGLPAGQVEAILLHELAHIRRHDYLVNVLQRLMEGLLFYHPAVWWMSGVIRAEREHCCDDVVVAMSGSAREYAAALTALEQNRCPRREPAVAATGGSLVKRIHRLLYPKRPNGTWTPLLASIVLVAVAVFAITASQAAPPPQTPGAESPYLKWLNEDVVYIITDVERTAFLKLSTDEERRMFIDQFWQRRNPVAGSAVNEFKQEHYRRIAYANQHFASSKPGWQTDRGHMYIVYGPPDEIETHPKGTRGAYASEVWMYHHLEGIGDKVTLTFIDRTGTNDYRLAPGNAH